jgi:two-component system sensor histidine kinase CpxA
MRISASFYGKLLLRLTLNFVLLGVLALAVLPEQLAMIDWATSLSGGRGLLLFVVAAGGSALLWYFFARQVAGAIGTLSDATEQIADGSFDVRAETGRADELGRLGDAISRMAARLEGYVNGQKRFLGDTAHELCSPLARMQMAVGIIEGNARPEQKEYIADIADEVRHMSDLVNELLSFSKASLQPGEVKIQTIRLAPIVEMAVKRESTGKADVTVSVPAELEVRANTQLLARAIGNLLRNAMRYAGHCGPIGIKAEQRRNHVYIVVWDSGPGIDADHIDRIFDPFYRPDASRTSTTGGVGLGMAIVKTCVETCGGKVVCKPRRSQGLKVIIRLGTGSVGGDTSATAVETDVDESS